MMYWKEGFHDTPVEGSVEITNEKWEELLDGQSQGLEIYENEEGFPALREYVYSFEILKELKTQEIKQYSKSDVVSSFLFKGEQAWIDSEERNRLRLSVETYKAAALDSINVWINMKCHPMYIDDLSKMLLNLELYCIKCDDATMRHIAMVAEATTLDELNAIDITKDYPNKYEYT